MNLYKRFIRPRLFRYDPEEIHGRVLRGLGCMGKIPILRDAVRHACTVHDKRLEQQLFGLTFSNPVGLAAGMDKNGEALVGLESLGLGSLEMGTVTGLAQEGNSKPRIFRIPDDEALINRMGFNGPGAVAIEYHLQSTRLPRIPLGISFGKSAVVPVNDMDEVADDYCYTLTCLHRFADFFVIIVSSPNTPGLRNLLEPKSLRDLLVRIKRKNDELSRRQSDRSTPIMVKLSPDVTGAELDGILGVVQEQETGIDGVVVTNTTKSRDGLKTTGITVNEVGGLSGKPLHNRAVEMTRYVHRRLPQFPIIGVGGIFSAQDAHDLIVAGANMVQVCTGLVFEGPGLPRRINSGLIRLMVRDGIESIGEYHPDVNRS